MNSLSWLLYAADVAGSVSATLSVATFFGGLGAIGFAVSYAVTIGSPAIYSWDNDDKASKLAAHSEMRKELARYAKLCAVIFASCALVASIIPSKDTVYAIAASEMGERVLTSATGDKAVKALDAWLDRQIAGESK